jgi:hypothetical protein
MFVTCASPAVASVSLTMCYHSCRLPRSRLRLFRCATSAAMCLLSLNVVFHSRRLRIGCAAVGAEFAVCGVVSGGWLAPLLLAVWVRVGWVWVGCWRLSFLRAVSSLSDGFTDASVCACLVPLWPLFLPFAVRCARCISTIRRTLCPLHIYVRKPRTVAALTSAFLRLRGVLLRTQAKCGACCQLIGACFVLSRLVRTGRSGHVYAPYARYGTIFFC